MGTDDKRSKRLVTVDLVLGMLVCFLFFGLLEGILRLIGWPALDPANDPFAGFSELKPLYIVSEGVASTAAHKIRLFNEVSFPVKKGPASYRVFTLGGSTTYGEPYDGKASFSRWLQDLLEASCVGKKFEVINAGGLSYASYRVVPLIKEVLTFNPDLIIVYTGHNEFLERRTYSGLFDQGTFLLTLRSRVDELKVYQALKKLLLPVLPHGMSGSRGMRAEVPPQRNPRPSPTEGQRKGPEESVFQGEVATILDEGVVGPEAYHRDETFSTMVTEHFAYNLRKMIQICRQAGIPIIFIDPSSNLRDCPPFKSEHTKGLSLDAVNALRTNAQAASREMAEGGFPSALVRLSACIRDDPLFAEYHYFAGQALLGLGRNAEALTAFVRARDLDVCPLRCTSPLRDQLIKVTREEKALLVPFHETVVKRACTSGSCMGVPGNESFLDHVHPTLELSQILAELILDRMIANGLVTPTETLAPEARSALYAKGVSSFDETYIAMKDLRLGRLLFWAGQRDAAREPFERAAGKLREWDIVELLARLLMQVGSMETGVREYERAAQSNETDPYLQLTLVNAYLEAGQRSKATEVCEKLAADDSCVPEATAYLAMLYREDGKAGQALRLVEAGLEKHPDNGSLLAAKSLVIAELGEGAAAFDILMKAVRIDEHNVRNLPVLARIFAQKGRKDDADRCLRTAAEMGYVPEKE